MRQLVLILCLNLISSFASAQNLDFEKSAQAIHENPTAYITGGLGTYLTSVIAGQATQYFLLSALKNTNPLYVSPIIAGLDLINMCDAIERLLSLQTRHKPLVSSYNPMSYIASWMNAGFDLSTHLKSPDDKSWNEAFEQGQNDFALASTFTNGLLSVLRLNKLWHNFLAKPDTNEAKQSQGSNNPEDKKPASLLSISNLEDVKRYEIMRDQFDHITAMQAEYKKETKATRMAAFPSGYQVPLNSCLDIDFNGKAIRFWGHELVAIAQNLLNGKTGEHKYMPTAEDDEITLQRIKNPNSAQQENPYADRFYIRAVATPNHITLPSSLQEILYIIQHLPNQEQNQHGWWLSFGNNLLFVNKNTEHDGKFYITDHGSIIDIQNEVRAVAIETPWISSAQTEATYLADVQLIVENLPNTPEKRTLFSKNFRLKLFQNVAAPLSIQIAKNPFLDDYLVLLVNTLADLAQRENGDFFKRILKENSGGIRMADKIIKNHVLLEIHKRANQGDRTYTYRPSSSDGKLNAGSTYKTFARQVKEHISKGGCSHSDLAYMARQILIADGRSETTPPDFLHPLVTALLISEPVRNPLSVYSGIMLLDLIENEVSSSDGLGNNLFDFEHILISAFDPNSGVKFLDMYGKAINADKFAGAHPMVQWEAVRQSQQALAENAPLTPAHQKEASLFLHWLYALIDSAGNSHSPISCQLHNIKGVAAPQKPTYSQISYDGISTVELTTSHKNCRKHAGTVRNNKKDGVSSKNAEDRLAEEEKNRDFLQKKFWLQKYLIEPLFWLRLMTEKDLFPRDYEGNDHGHVLEIFHLFNHIKDQLGKDPLPLPVLREPYANYFQGTRPGAFDRRYLEQIGFLRPINSPNRARK